jgi:cell division protease FtsH
MAFETDRQPLYLQVPQLPSSKEYSDETSREIDSEISRIVEQAHGRAREILTEKSALLEKVAQVLLEKEVIEGEELKTLMAEAT